MHQADALDGAVLLKLALQLALSHIVRQAGHKERLEGVTLRCNATLGGGRGLGKGRVDMQRETRSVLQGSPWQH